LEFTRVGERRDVRGVQRDGEPEADQSGLARASQKEPAFRIAVGACLTREYAPDVTTVADTRVAAGVRRQEGGIPRGRHFHRAVAADACSREQPNNPNDVAMLVRMPDFERAV
jgi:hypothetical protein